MDSAKSETIGIRELRQNASRYVDLAATGSSIQVTRRGQVVAYLVPAPERDQPLGDLMAAGVVTPAADPRDVLDVDPVQVDTPLGSPSAALQQMRDDERW